ncbi:MAG: acetyltransferase [Gemmatimonadetes bacterium]|nr:acetyltransferase [Gemmatimonadota bacterium]
MRRPLIVYGCGGLGREVAMAARVGSEHEVVGFIDDSVAPGSQVHDLPVLGGVEAMERYDAEELGVYVAIGSIPVHRAVVERIWSLSRSLSFPNIIHPDATVDLERVSLGIGNYVAAGARLTAEVRIGDFNIINLNSVLAHDVVLGDRCQINPGAVLNGQDVVGDEVVIGAGAVVMPRTEVGAGAVVGIGAVVAGPVPPGCTVVGNPARVVRRPSAPDGSEGESARS